MRYQLTDEITPNIRQGARSLAEVNLTPGKRYSIIHAIDIGGDTAFVYVMNDLGEKTRYNAGWFIPAPRRSRSLEPPRE